VNFDHNLIKIRKQNVKVGENFLRIDSLIHVMEISCWGISEMWFVYQPFWGSIWNKPSNL